MSNNPNEKVVSKTFEAFPQARVAASEAVAASREPYIPPNMPRMKPKPGEGPKQSSRTTPHISGLDLTNNLIAEGIPAMHLQSHPPQQQGQGDPNAHLHQAQLPTTVPVHAPGFTTAVSDPEGILVALPSNYAFYDFKDLYVRPFKGLHLSKLSRAHNESSLQALVEVVSSVVSTSRGDTEVAFDLTINDFYFLLYWLRTNSFTKSVYTHTATCFNQSHIERVTSGELTKDTLTHTTLLHKTTLKVTNLDAAPNPDLFILDYPNARLSPTNMRDTIALVEHPNFADTEFQYVAQLASYLRIYNPEGQNLSLDDRVAIVNDMSVDDIEVIKQYENAVIEYGVDESVNVTCKGCGASWVSKITLDAHCFLPSGKHAGNS